MSGAQQRSHADGAERLPLAALRGAADILCRYEFEIWHYGDSVGIEGLLAAGDLLEEAAYPAWVHGLIKGWIPRAEPFGELDNTAPGHAICLCAERTGDDAILPAAARLARWLASRPTLQDAYVSFANAPLREPYGGAGLDASGRRLLADPGPGVFVDCLHFDAPFLVHVGRLAGDADLRRAGVGQALALVELLQDADGLFHHFYLERSGERYGSGWSRGQGWALLGLLDVLEQLDPGEAARGPLEGALQRLVDALARTQHASGHWPALCGRPDTYRESSVALFAAAGLRRGIRLGLLDPALERVAARAWAAGLDVLGADGRLAGVSAAVWACTNIDHYAHVPVGFQVPWGQGPLLLAAHEAGRSVVA